MLSNARSLTAFAFAILALAAVLLSGCGKGQDDALLAVVGDKEIRASYYEDRLSRLEQNELPRDQDGRYLDTALPEGKEEFLTTIINKELMVAKATQLGYSQEPRIAQARESMSSYEASLAMSQDVINAQANEISNEEFDAFYEHLGEMRRCKYIVTNFEAGAASAREMALAGADWDDIAARYHEGDIPPTGILEVSVPWGRFNIRFEDQVYATRIGEVSAPIHTDYGWWLVRPEEVITVDRPDKKESEASILEVIHRRKMARLQVDFRHQVYDKFEVEVNDDALWIVWQALPEGEILIDRATDKPIPQDELADLEITAADLDTPFYSYLWRGETKAYTVGDYKNRYDRMNTFQRPKREQMVGGLKSHILQELERALMPEEARNRGYFENPDVVAKVSKKMEELMVTSLYSEVITIDERITAAELEEYWRIHHELFDEPERRGGRLVIAADEEQAKLARQEAIDGTPWQTVVDVYGTDPDNKERSGKHDEISARATGPVRDAFFAIGEGEVSDPVAVGDGRWAVVRVDRILPGKPVEFQTQRDALGAAIKAQRKEDLLNSLLAEWAAEFGVTRYDEKLETVKSWQELTYVEPSQYEEVPR